MGCYMYGCTKVCHGGSILRRPAQIARGGRSTTSPFNVRMTTPILGGSSSFSFHRNLCTITAFTRSSLEGRKKELLRTPPIVITKQDFSAWDPPRAVCDSKLCHQMPGNVWLKLRSDTFQALIWASPYRLYRHRPFAGVQRAIHSQVHLQ